MSAERARMLSMGLTHSDRATASRLSRGSFLAGGLAAGALPAIAAAPLATLRVGGTPSPYIVPVIWGQRDGVFAKYGVDVQFQQLSSGSAVVAAVIGGSFDIGASGVFQVIQGYAKGIPLVLESVAATYNSTHPQDGFVVAPASALTGPRDLSGKTIAVPSLSGSDAYVISDWIDRAGGDVRSVKFVGLPMGETSLAIIAGRVDGAVLDEPFLSDAVERNHCKIIGRPYDVIAPHFGLTWYFTNQDYAQKNSDILRRFRRGYAEATAYVLAHKAQMVPLIANYTGTSSSLVERILPSLNLGAGADPVMLQPVIDLAAKMKIIRTGFPARELIDPAALSTS